jgi:hypothetical protein
MRYFVKVLFLSFLFLSTPIFAQSHFLVSEEEMVKSNANKVFFYPKSAISPDAPKIELVSPKLDSTISSPTQIELKFLPKTPATTKPETFRILYGTFQIDITERLLKVATVTPQGINVPEAKLPNGRHKLVLNVQDSDGRVGSRLIEFEIK